MPSQYIDKINLPGNKEIELRDSISEMKDVVLTSLASDQVLSYNGTNWENSDIPTVPEMSTVQMQVTFTDQSTATYNVYIQPSV